MSIELRPATTADEAACVAFTGERVTTLGLQYERDARDLAGRIPWKPGSDVVVAVDGPRTVGYAWLRNWVDFGYLEMWVDRDARRRRAGSELMAWAIADARSQSLPILRLFVDDSDVGAGRFLTALGFEPARGGVRMDLASASSVADPQWPSGFVVRTQPDKSDDLIDLVWRIDQAGFATNPSFASTPRENFARTVARDDFDPDLTWFAFADDDAEAGFCIASHLPDLSAGVIEDIAVLPDFRRSGLARALLRHAVRALRSRGAELVVLGTGFDNHAAQALYRSEGFVETHRRQSWSREL